MKTIITMLIGLMMVISIGVACDMVDVTRERMEIRHAQIECVTDVECYELTGINY